MIDLGLLRDDSDRVITLLKKKEPSFNAQALLEYDKKVRELRLRVEKIRHEKNLLAKQGHSGLTDEMRNKALELAGLLKDAEKELEQQEKIFNELYLTCPNIPSQDIPDGGKQSNKIVKIFGEKPIFSFPLKHHVELGNALGWFDFPTAATITASNFVLYKGEAVKLLYALTFFMLKHNQEHGYQMTLPPYMVNEKSLLISGNFPKFRNEVYAMPEDQLYLIPTAEVSLANMYRDHIFAEQDLPLRMTAWTSCFRREAGSYGAQERGLIRIHQFEKVELYTYCQPDDSNKELERMLACAEGILQKLGLHYRVSLLAMQDCSFQASKTFDIEVFFPASDSYKEVSSCSNCTDFQARRGAMRYRKESLQGKTMLVHTLNASSLAIPRLMVALMETYQKPDGSIDLPDILKPFLL